MTSKSLDKKILVARDIVSYEKKTYQGTVIN